MGLDQKDFEIGSGLYTEIVKIVDLTRWVCYFVNDNLNMFFFCLNFLCLFLILNLFFLFKYYKKKNEHNFVSLDLWVTLKKDKSRLTNYKTIFH